MSLVGNSTNMEIWKVLKNLRGNIFLLGNLTEVNSPLSV